MKRFLVTLGLTFALSGIVLGGEIPSVPGPNDDVCVCDGMDGVNGAMSNGDQSQDEYGAYAALVQIMVSIVV